MQAKTSAMNEDLGPFTFNGPYNKDHPELDLTYSNKDN